MQQTFARCLGHFYNRPRDITWRPGNPNCLRTTGRPESLCVSGLAFGGGNPRQTTSSCKHACMCSNLVSKHVRTCFGFGHPWAETYNLILATLHRPARVGDCIAASKFERFPIQVCARACHCGWCARSIIPRAGRIATWTSRCATWRDPLAKREARACTSCRIRARTAWPRR